MEEHCLDKAKAPGSNPGQGTRDLIMRISIWPDGTYCEAGDECDYLQWMSDDYCTIEIDEETADALYSGNIDPQDLIN